jgi:aconitate hydratase
LGRTLSEKLLDAHRVETDSSSGNASGNDLALRIDQTLTQDATGTMVFLQFEALGLPKIAAELSVNYVDHNTLQLGYESPDDHRYLQSVCRRFGVKYSRAGNGICHQVHLERFSVPGKTLLGSDSHTTTCGGAGMLAIGAGGLDVAAAMAGYPFYIPVPKVMGIKLTGALNEWVSAKDVILEVLRRLSVKGGLGYILEYFGEGVETLSVPERATIANMGTETGALTSVFPSDLTTREFFQWQGRVEDWVPLAADDHAHYDEIFELDLSTLVPLVAQPHMPDKVETVENLGPIQVHQVLIGSCTNSSLQDLLKAYHMLRGKKIHPDVSVGLVPGSRQVLAILAARGWLSDVIASGVRVLEPACGPCIGMGFAPPSQGVALRTFNRNFQGRSGTKDAQVFLVSPETAIASAMTGVLTDPRILGIDPVRIPEVDAIPDDSLILEPSMDNDAPIERGPNIKPLPLGRPVGSEISGKVLLKVDDNVTTDHIMPGGSKILPLRSNIPAMAQYCFSPLDPGFAECCKREDGGLILAGANYGQGSSREHAALVPMYLGIKAVLAKSFARIHRSNLINFGILPLTLEHAGDYDRIDPMDHIDIYPGEDLGTGMVEAQNRTKDYSFSLRMDLSPREARICSAGGLLNLIREERAGIQ